MANSEIDRLGHSLVWHKDGTAKWDYAVGLFTFSLLQLDQQAPDARYPDFVKQVFESFIGPDGSIHAYRAGEYQLDHVEPGRALLALFKLTGEERYERAATRLRQQLKTQPRTGGGGFWHKQRYPHQMWLDGLYMAEPFYAEYAEQAHEPAASFDDIALQFRLADQHLYDPGTGLYYHGWDESKTQAWANPISGTSSNFWARGMGWYGMALVDVLDFIPIDHPARPQLLGFLRKLANGLVKYQDPSSGLWYQVIDQGVRPGNYLEASASCMFVYTLAKGSRRGYLAEECRAAALKGYRGILKSLLKLDGTGQVTLTSCCSVAGLGSGRDGSYEYYIHEPVVENDLKGVGPFILAGMEVTELTGAEKMAVGSRGAPQKAGDDPGPQKPQTR